MSRKTSNAHLELPSNLPLDPVALQVLNDRLRSIAVLVEQQATLTDAGGERIRNVGDPQAPGDALNLGFADRRYARGIRDLSALLQRLASLEAEVAAIDGGGPAPVSTEGAISYRG